MDALDQGVSDTSYDSSITPYLDAPFRSVFEKLPGAADFAAVNGCNPD